MKLKSPWVKAGLWLVCALAFYIVVYFFDSVAGGYKSLPSGKFRPVLLSSPDTCVWQPRFGEAFPHQEISGEVTVHHDILGGVFAPLILLDQNFFHESFPAFTANYEPTPELQKLSKSQWHPLEKELADLDEELLPQIAADRKEHNKAHWKKFYKIRAEIIWLQRQADNYKANIFGAAILCLFLIQQLFLLRLFKWRDRGFNKRS